MPNTLLDNMIVSVYDTGFFDYALPFMLVFAVLYGILQKINLFGKDKGKINVLFAAIVSIMILPFGAELNYFEFISKFAIILVGFVALGMMLGILGYKFNETKNSVIFLVISVLFIGATNFFDLSSLQNMSGEIIYTILIALTFGVIAWLVTGKDVVPQKTAQPKKQEKQYPKKEEEEEGLSRDEFEQFLKTQEKIQKLQEKQNKNV